MCCCRFAYCRYVDKVDMPKVLLWVILYTHLNVRSPCTAGLFCLCMLCASINTSAGNIRLSFISRRWKRRCFRRKSRLAFILWQWYFVPILCSVIQSSGFFSEKLKFLNLFRADESQLLTGSHFWAQAECTHMLAKANVGTHTPRFISEGGTIELAVFINLSINRILNAR